MPISIMDWIRSIMERLKPASIFNHFPGFLVCVVVATAAQFISEHYGAPVMLMALLLGMALHFLSVEGRCMTGIQFCGRAVLRIGVALMGVRISASLLAVVGPWHIALLGVALLLCIAFAMLLGRFLRVRKTFALLTGGAVAICGASAAMAIASVLPRHKDSEKNLLFTVVGVTVLSTVAMILYPILAGQLFDTEAEIGFFLGATIHDVAQVVGAGFSVSENTGDIATLVKLIRVSLLAPVVVVIALAVRSQGRHTGSMGSRPPLLPGFVLGFLVLAALNSFDLIPLAITDGLGEISRWSLIIAISAVGMKTSLGEVMGIGRSAMILILADTIFLAAVILGGLAL